ncbi:hypothetical protein HDU77_003734 [Chytriomyces hyalinus]|nr:hypothetical protein HDU77_003734 [Chytriomyces hyalinus]
MQQYSNANASGPATTLSVSENVRTLKCLFHAPLTNNNINNNIINNTTINNTTINNNTVNNYTIVQNIIVQNIIINTININIVNNNNINFNINKNNNYYNYNHSNNNYNYHSNSNSNSNSNSGNNSHSDSDNTTTTTQHTAVLDAKRVVWPSDRVFLIQLQPPTLNETHHLDAAPQSPPAHQTEFVSPDALACTVPLPAPDREELKYFANQTTGQNQVEVMREMDDAKEAATRPTTPATTPTSMKTAATRPTSATNTNYNFNMATTPTSIATATASPTTTADPDPITNITTTPHASCSTISMVLLPSAASTFIINSDTASTTATTIPTQTARSAQEEEEEVGHDGGEGRGAQVNREEQRADLPMEIAELWGAGIGDGMDLGTGVIELGEDFERGVAAAEEWVGDVLGPGVQGKVFVDEEGLFEVDINMVVREEEPKEYEDFFAQF